MMKPYFDSVPRELEEAAWIDGCGTWSAFWRVTLPLSSPGLAATAVICFILSWNDFFYALILTRTQASTAPVAIVNFIQYTGWEWGRIAAAGTLVMLPVVAFSILVRNYLVRGLAAGGVKE
jgi:multiple sugar transport system permease protein